MHVSFVISRPRGRISTSARRLIIIQTFSLSCESKTSSCVKSHYRAKVSTTAMIATSRTNQQGRLRVKIAIRVIAITTHFHISVIESGDIRQVHDSYEHIYNTITIRLEIRSVSLVFDNKSHVFYVRCLSKRIRSVRKNLLQLTTSMQSDAMEASDLIIRFDKYFRK